MPSPNEWYKTNQEILDKEANAGAKTPATSGPRTPTGWADHDEAWSMNPPEETGNHQYDREGCLMCAKIAAIEQEAADAEASGALRDALEWIATRADRRPDGTYNYDRDALRQKARAALASPAIVGL